MIKEKNEETGEVKVIFSSEEFKKLKIFGGAAAVLLILSISLAGWAGYSTNALHAENELYRSQLKARRVKRINRLPETVFNRFR